MDIFRGLSKKATYKRAKEKEATTAVIDSIDAKLNKCLSERPDGKRRHSREL